MTRAHDNDVAEARPAEYGKEGAARGLGVIRTMLRSRVASADDEGGHVVRRIGELGLDRGDEGAGLLEVEVEAEDDGLPVGSLLVLHGGGTNLVATGTHRALHEDHVSWFLQAQGKGRPPSRRRLGEPSISPSSDSSRLCRAQGGEGDRAGVSAREVQRGLGLAQASAPCPVKTKLLAAGPCGLQLIASDSGGVRKASGR